MLKSGLKLHSLILTQTVVAKQRRERYAFALDMRERPVCYWRRVFFANETMITDNFSDPKQKFIRGYGQPMRWRLIKGILNSSTFVSTINEFFTKELTRNYIGWLIVVQHNAPCHVLKKVSIFLLIPCTYALFYYLDHGWT